MEILKVGTYSFYRSIYPPVESNMYVLLENNEAIVVDSNICPELLSIFRQNSIVKVHFFLTHEHYDHSHGITWFKKKIKTILYCHQFCSDGLSTKKRSLPRLVALVIARKDKENGTNLLEKFNEEFIDYSFQADFPLQNEDVIKIGKHTIQCIYTPGHSLGSCMYMLDDKFAFTGDSLILNHKIITSFRSGSKEDFYEITLPKLRALPPDIMIMPGHGRPFKKKEFNFDIYHV